MSPKLSIAFFRAQDFAKSIHIKGRIVFVASQKLIKEGRGDPGFQDHPTAKIGTSNLIVKGQGVFVGTTGHRLVVCYKVFELDCVILVVIFVVTLLLGVCGVTTAAAVAPAAVAAAAAFGRRGGGIQIDNLVVTTCPSFCNEDSAGHNIVHTNGAVHAGLGFRSHADANAQAQGQQAQPHEVDRLGGRRRYVQGLSCHRAHLRSICLRHLQYYCMGGGMVGEN